jgi:signal transduction histidine kinase/Flp pilus assembly protein TadD
MCFHRLSSIVTILLLCLQFGNAQTPTRRLDSLSQLIRRHSADTTGLLVSADLCFEYRFISQDSALRFGKKGIILGKKLRHKPGLAQVYSDVAFIYYDRGQYDSAVYLWTESLQLRTSLGDKARMASLHTKIGSAEFKKGDYDKALQHQLMALRIYEESGTVHGAGQALNNVAAVYEHQRDLDKALEYYSQALQAHKKANASQEMGITLINIGNIHFLSKAFSQAKKKYNEALQIVSENVQPSARAVVLNNLSEIYVMEGKPDSALHYSTLALNLRQRTGETAGIISSLNMIGRIKMKQGDFSNAEKYLRDALELATTSKILPEEGKLHLNLYELYKEKGDWKESLEAYVQYATIRDSLLNETSRKEVAKLQVKYESEKKEQQISLQAAALSEKQLQLERNSMAIVALVSILTLLTGIIILLRNRQKRKAEIARKESEIALRETYIKASIESQEIERKRFARDLHDGLGQWISSLRLILSQLHRDDSEDKKFEVLDRAEKVLQDINGEFRSIAFNLMPQTLVNSGLATALDEMVLRLNSMGCGVFTTSTFRFPERLPELVEVSLYRVVQEWTNNILKYASATKTEIQLTGHDDELIIMIEDNGNGFDPGILEEGKGNGWKNIRSRINLVKGSVEVDSRQGKAGTTFTVTVPKISVGKSSRREPGLVETATRNHS